jgi:type II secretory pathway component PulC
MHMLKINRSSIGTAGDTAMRVLTRLPFSWQPISAVVLGVVLAKWFWILFTPQVIYTSVAPANSNSIAAGRLFGVASNNEMVSQGVALPNVKLLGVFTATIRHPGFAILMLDDKRQLGIKEGEEVAAGTKLLAVHADYVVLENAGVQQTVMLNNKYTAAPNKGITRSTATPADIATRQAAAQGMSVETQNRLRMLRR